MRLTTRSVLLAIALVLALVAAACGDDGGGGSSDGTVPSGSDGSGAPSGDPVRVGVLLTLSGPTASVGETYRQGAELWLASVEDEGFLGRPVELVVRDDGGTADQATRATRELLDQEGVDFVVGPFSAGAAGGSVPLIAQEGKLQILASAFLDGRDATRYPLVFPTEISQAQSSEDWVQQAIAFGYERMAYFAPNNAFGQDVQTQVEAAVAATDGQIELVASQFYEPGATDVTSQVQELQDSDADVLLFNDIATAGYINGITTADNLGWEVPILGNSAMAEPQIAEALPASTVERMYVLGFTRPALRPLPDASATFLSDYKAFVGTDDLSYRLVGPMTMYDSLEMVRHTAEEVGTDDAEEIATALEEHGYQGIKAEYRYGTDEHLGVLIDELAPAQAGTFEDGTLSVAE